MYQKLQSMFIVIQPSMFMSSQHFGRRPCSEICGRRPCWSSTCVHQWMFRIGCPMQISVSCHTSKNVQGLTIVADRRLASELDTRIVDASTVQSDSTMRQSSDGDVARWKETALATSPSHSCCLIDGRSMHARQDTASFIKLSAVRNTGWPPQAGWPLAGQKSPVCCDCVAFPFFSMSHCSVLKCSHVLLFLIPSTPLSPYPLILYPRHK